MIPKSLLTVFLALQALEQPSGHTSSPAQYDVKVIDDMLPALDNYHEAQQRIGTQGDDIVVQKQTSYPFDALASGDWNNDLIVDGVQITNDATSRLWSLPDAFPNLKPLHGGKKAWGPYPQGNNFTVKFDQAYNDRGYTFGWLVNGRLSAGSYKVTISNEGRKVSEGTGSWKDDQWTSWGSGCNVRGDQIDVQITEGIPTGLLLLEYLGYGNC